MNSDPQKYFPTERKIYFAANKPEQMKSWQGCHGFDPAVQRQITNAIPPYLLGDEAHTAFPFGALDSASIRQHTIADPSIANTAAALNDEALNVLMDLDDSNKRESGINFSAGDTQVISQPLTAQGTECSEILSRQLGNYAREQIASGIALSDDALKLESRKLLHNDCNPWKQTAADNPKWLALFKKEHGIAVDFVDSSFRLDDGNGGAGPSIIACRENPFDLNSLDQRDMTDLGLSDMLFDH